MGSIFNSFKLHETLSSEIWLNASTNDFSQIKLEPEIRKTLLSISKDFIDSFKIESLDIEDVLFVGSLANYNWSEFSDIDIHVVIDKNKLGDNPDVIEELFDAKKQLYNLKNDFIIKGYDVEIYGQDINESLQSVGVYSILYNKWVDEPKPDENTFDKKKVVTKVKEFMNTYNTLKDLDDSEEKLEKIESFKDKIRKYRKSGLSDGGELSNENLVFKYLRRSGFLEKVGKLKLDTNNVIHSLKEMESDNNYLQN